MTAPTIDLKALRGLAEKATGGPWSWSENGNILGHMPNGYDETREVCAVYTDDEETGAPDAPFILACVNYVRALLAAGDDVVRDVGVVTDAMVEAAARVVCSEAGEDFDSVGDFAQSVLLSTQRKAIDAAMEQEKGS